MQNVVIQSDKALMDTGIMLKFLF